MKKINTLIVLSIALLVQSCGTNTNNESIDLSQKETIKTYEVSFEGANLEKQIIKEGESLNQPNDPTKNDSIFGGWYFDSSYKDKATFPLTISSDTKLYALFTSYSDAFALARENTIGKNILGYEYDYSIDATASYSSISLVGNTTGNSKYSTAGDISFYDEHVNSGALFFDGSKYQIKKGNSLQHISLKTDGTLKKYEEETVDPSYTYDSSSFAKALFEYDSCKLKEIEKTNNPNEYKLNTSMNFSGALSMVSNFLNNPIVSSLLKAVPENSVDTGIYVTFSNGEVKTYKYEMNISISSIIFSLAYNLSFKNVNKAQTITPKEFPGISISSTDIVSTKTELVNYLNLYKNKEKSSYDYSFKMGVDFDSATEIDATIKGSAQRKLSDSKVFFYNDIEIKSDYENADLYKAADLNNIHVKKTMLANGDVYMLEKKTLSTNKTKVDPYIPSTQDSYFLFDIVNQINDVSFIQKVEDTKDNKCIYSIGITLDDVTTLLHWFDEVLTLDPLNRASVDVNMFGDFSDSSVKLNEAECTIVIKNNELMSIDISADGDFTTSLIGSRDFSSNAHATYYFKYSLDVTTDGASFQPFETEKDAK